jgi:DnaK suppressor protein
LENNQQEFFRELLNQRLNALLQGAGATLEQLTDEREVLADTIDIASMESSRDFTLRLQDRERRMVHKIQKALQTLNEGEYGICVACGEEIAYKRLLARPVATHCIDCKTEAEQLETRRRFA